MSVVDLLKGNEPVYLDGGMGTILQERGLGPGEYPEKWNIDRREDILSVHKAYFDAGSNIVNTNTFGANSLKFSKKELDDIIAAAVDIAREAAARSSGAQEKYISLDIGPCGKLLRPYGDFDFEEAVELFAEAVRIGYRCGVDMVTIETMADSYETKAAMLAVKENSDLPFFVTNAYGEDQKLMTGASPQAMIALIESMGASALGVNCSLGPDKLKPVIETMLKYSSIPVILKPNAGLPRVEDGRTIYDIDSIAFASEMKDLMAKGVKVAGGCCGTTPEYIGELVKETQGMKIDRHSDKNITWISSYTNALEFGDEPVLIGERLNPTGKKMLKQALVEENMDYILREAIAQDELGVHALDVNVGLPEVDEETLMPKVVSDIQSVVDLPLCIDTSNAAAMEKALRRYNGKALINSVNGKKESMDAVFPIVKQYGGSLVALTLDEDGIPDDAEGRIRIARNIIEEASKYGISKKDLVFDALTLTVSADPTAAATTLETVARIGSELGCKTVLGVSNVSFGLPARDAVNRTFFACALDRGLSSAIMNPKSADMMGTYYAYMALKGKDENFEKYIGFFERYGENKSLIEKNPVKENKESDEGSDLQYAIIKGLKDQARTHTERLVSERDPLEIIEKEVIPALNRVGDGFERKEIYLPQLLMSAEAAGAAFEVIKSIMVTEEGVANEAGRSKFVLATVKGDIHDIGKNIVKLLLQNYGFDVKDMGKDVPPEDIVDAVIKEHAQFCGLSALMTTTVPAMEETIKKLKDAAPWCKVVVGGAVLNREYAHTIGADKYGKDAMETVRYAEENDQ